MPIAPKNLFTSVFRPGESVPDMQFGRFERFLPRGLSEPDLNYARRLEQAGLAFVITSEEMRDITEYKNRLAAAEDAGLPLAMLTGPLPNPVHDRMQERQLKSPHDYLREAREAHTPEGGT